MKQQQSIWLWLVPLLLLITALALPLGDADSLWYDEVWSLKNAGGAHYGPLSLTGIWEQVALQDPHQAFGYPYLLAAWGALVGWSELAGRYLSLLAGLLTVALTYRLGTETHSRVAGLFASVVLGLSAFFIYYTHELRAFTLVALAAATTLYAYQRLLTQKTLRPQSAILFLSGSLGLLYTHYFAAATLLGALGLYHLLLVAKTRRWWQITALAVVVALCFLPAVPAFLRGFTRFSPDDVRRIPLTAPEVLNTLVTYAGNQFIGTWLLIGAGLVGLWQRQRTHPALWIGLFSVGITVLANELLGILEPQRVRYVIVIWPLLALWVGVGLSTLLHWLQRSHFALVMLALVAWMTQALLMHNGTWIDPLRAEDVLRWRTMTPVMLDHASPDDLFAYYGGDGQAAYGVRLGFEYATAPLPFPALFTSTLYEGDTREWALDQVTSAQRVWYGVDRRNPLNNYHPSFEQELSNLFITCGRFVENEDMTLDLYASQPAFCPADTAPQAILGGQIELKAVSDAQVQGNRLSIQLQLRLAAEFPPETYNLALHLVANGEQAPAVQLDRPLPATPIALVDATLAISDILTGDYTLYAIVYNWRDGTRLSTETGAERFALAELTFR